MAWQSRIEVDTPFSFLVIPFILLGLGMGFTMSPMSTAAMNAVDRAKAGVASGTLSMTRMVGGTFGIATLGAVVAHVTDGAGAADKQKYVDALNIGLGVAAAATLLAAVAAWLLVDSKRPQQEAPAQAEPEAAMV
jgi:MFS family permease